MMLGEVSPGGAGAGIYTILAFAIIAVFIGGLMVGRTPEYLGKKIQAREVKLAGLSSRHAPAGPHLHRHRRLRPCRHGPARRTRARTASPRSSTPSPRRRTTTAPRSRASTRTRRSTTSSAAVGLFFGRFADMIPVLALGGVARREEHRAGLGRHFRTDNPLFVGLFVGVILIVGALTFFPAVALGPIVEQLSSRQVLLDEPTA